jgi:Fe-S-cluster containining protein
VKTEYAKYLTNAIQEKELLKKTFQRLKSKKNKEVDDLFHQLHTKAFQKMDCLACANCCKTTSPIFRDVDIKRIAKHLRLKENQFIKSYLKMDEENDYVLQSSPCSFLDDDNTCSIYEFRPLACREYPHTDRKNMFQILDLTLKNTLVCPAVAKISSEIASKIQ